MSVSTGRFNPARMKQARLAAGFSHVELAREIRKSETNVGRWERGQHEPRGSAVAAIAQATGRDIEFFYTEGDADDVDEEDAMRRVVADVILNGSNLERDLLKLVRLVRGEA